MLTVADNLVVSLDYSLHHGDGEIVDSSDGGVPLEIVQGRGQIIPGLENALYGMKVGEEKQVVVESAEGYGEFDIDLFETLPRTVFPPSLELEPGMGFRMRNEAGTVVVVYVDHLEDDQVIVNLNHPLAGKTLCFDVKITDLREATPEELVSECEGCAGCGGSCESSKSCCA